MVLRLPEGLRPGGIAQVQIHHHLGGVDNGIVNFLTRLLARKCKQSLHRTILSSEIYPFWAHEYDDAVCC